MALREWPSLCSTSASIHLYVTKSGGTRLRGRSLPDQARSTGTKYCKQTPDVREDVRLHWTAYSGRILAVNRLLQSNA
eukprot:scaffold1505_cov256-Pinguiococcus_pyrenoidosus.AAC.6